MRKTRHQDRNSLPIYTQLYLNCFVPAIVEFAGWVLDEAVRSGKERLYFLSRDGYQIYLTACRLAELRKLSVECRYLHVSRYSVRIPAYHLDIKGSLDRICSGGMEVTLERILKRGALTEAEALEVAERIGRKDSYKDTLNRRQISELKEVLGREPLFLKYVEAHSVEAYENTMGYLRQEGLLSDIPYAIVDSGWVGTFQQSLQSLIHSCKPHIRVEGYYFGLYEIPRSADARDYHGWYFAPGTGLRRKVTFSNSLFEAVCSADEGMTVGYFQKDGRYLPQLDPEGNPNGERLRRNLEVLEGFLTDSERLILRRHNFTKNLERFYRAKSCGCDKDKKVSVEKLFKRFMFKPSIIEVEHLGGFLFSDDVLTGNYQEVAARLTREEIRNLYILHRIGILNGWQKGSIRESAWVEGSIVRCGTDKGQKKDGLGIQQQYIRRSLRHIRWYKYLVFGRKQLKARLHAVTDGILRIDGLLRRKRHGG